MNLKKILKTIKLNESTISAGFGAVVIAIVAFLVISYFKTNRGSVLTDNTANTTDNEIVSESTYVVKKGDTLWSIASSQLGNGFKYTDIVELNKISNPNTIEEGQKLELPEAENTSTNKVSNSETYTVKKGDTLWKIAIAKYNDGYMWTKIAQANKLSNPNIIHSGNVFVLPSK